MYKILLSDAIHFKNDEMIEKKVSLPSEKNLSNQNQRQIK